MSALRAILAAMWLLLSLSATAHAMPALHDSHHMDMATHHTPAQSDQGVMPCCNQPILAASESSFPAQRRRPVLMRLSPPSLPSLTGLSIAAESRPPKYA